AWPSRCGDDEDWLTGERALSSLGAFLRREALPNGVAVALVGVATTVAGDRRMYVTGGQQLDEGFLSTLVLPAGMRVLLYRSGVGPENPALAAVRPLIDTVVKQRREIVETVGQGA